MAAVNNRTLKRVDVDTAQAVSNSPLAILTRASSSVRAVNLRTRPVALCRTVHITGGPFSTALREKDRRTLSKRLPDVTAFRDTSSHSANASGMASPQAKAARPIAARLYAYAERSTCPDCNRRISPNSFSSFSRAAKSAADGATAGEPETAPSAGESGFGLSSGKSRSYLLVSSMTSPSPVILYRVRDALEGPASQAQVALSHPISPPAWRFGHGIWLTAVNNFHARGCCVTCRQHFRNRTTST
jgi:hypothetical protein